MPGDDPFHLGRFLDAQQNIYTQVCTELAAGEKRTHWMWFIFPQVAGLGSSAMAQRYAITDLAEARAYMQHLVLGARLRECTQLVLNVTEKTVEDIFGYPDDLKFHSSMTLFARAVQSAPAGTDIFERALQHFFNGKPDLRTLSLLS